MVLKLAEHCFTNDDEDASKAFEIGILALILKDVTSHRGTALLESVCKLTSTIVTCQLSGGIEFHDAIHGHQAKRGTHQRV
jgi:hypothetical protein